MKYAGGVGLLEDGKHSEHRGVGEQVCLARRVAHKVSEAAILLILEP